MLKGIFKLKMISDWKMYFRWTIMLGASYKIWIQNGKNRSLNSLRPGVYDAPSGVCDAPENSKLMRCIAKGQYLDSRYWQPVIREGKRTPFSKQAEHSGIVRWSDPGNMVSVLARLSAHTRALYWVSQQAWLDGTMATRLRLSQWNNSLVYQCFSAVLLL